MVRVTIPLVDVARFIALVGDLSTRFQFAA